jgi:hypothetical protein
MLEIFFFSVSNNSFYDVFTAGLNELDSVLSNVSGALYCKVPVLVHMKKSSSLKFFYFAISKSINFSYFVEEL